MQLNAKYQRMGLSFSKKNFLFHAEHRLVLCSSPSPDVIHALRFMRGLYRMPSCRLPIPRLDTQCKFYH